MRERNLSLFLSQVFCTKAANLHFVSVFFVKTASAGTQNFTIRSHKKKLEKWQKRGLKKTGGLRQSLQEWLKKTEAWLKKNWRRRRRRRKKFGIFQQENTENCHKIHAKMALAWLRKKLAGKVRFCPEWLKKTEAWLKQKTGGDLAKNPSFCF